MRAKGYVLGLALTLACSSAWATINPPTNFRTDASDFSDLDLPIGAIQAQLRWTDNADNETAYQVEVSTNGSTWFLSRTLAANAQGDDTEIIPWTSNRWYRVRAVNATEQSSYAGPIQIFGYMPPSRLGGSTADATHMTVTWDKAGGYIDGYSVQRATNAAFSQDLVQYFANASGSNTVSYTINFSFVANVIYYFRVASTNSSIAAPNGNSEFQDKPISYLACAPNGPPVAPLFVSQHMDGTANESLIIFDRQDLNGTGFKIEYSTNGGSTWFVPTVSPDIGNPRIVLTQSGMTDGMPYAYRLSETNAQGASSYTTWNFQVPLTPAGSPTVWYVVAGASGNATGTNRANAWPALGSINWPVLKPDDVVYVAGGNYTNVLVTFADGTYGHPITIKTDTNASYNGRVYVYGGIGFKSSYVTIDGAVSDAVKTSADRIGNNINLTVTQRATAESPASMPVAVGAVLLWAELTGAGSPISGEGDGDGLLIVPSSLGPTNVEVGYCWIHDNYGSGIRESVASVGYLSFGAVNLHHLLVEHNHNNFMSAAGAYDLHDSILRDWKGPGVAHPDGIQGGINKVRLWNNLVGNPAPSSAGHIYWDLGGSPTNADYAAVGNVFYDTYTNAGYNGCTVQLVLDTVSDGNQITNVLWANNVFYGRRNLSFAIVNNGHDNRVLKNWTVKNNLFLSGDLCDAAQGAFSSGGCRFAEADFGFDYNVVCGPETKFYYRTNNAVYDGVPLFANAEAFDAWSSLYKSNSSTAAGIVSDILLNFRPKSSDTVLLDKGADLSSLTNLVPGILVDLLGTTRGQNNKWDIGAVERDSTFQMQLGFDDDFYSTTNKHTIDLTGSGHEGLRFGRPASMTNYPTPITPSFDASVAGEFHFYPNDIQNGQTQYSTGDYIGVTNLQGWGSLSNMTVMGWVKYYSPQADNGTIFSSGHIDLGNWRLGHDGDTKTMFTLSPTGAGLIPDNKYLAFPDNLVTNQWHHYAVSWSGTNHTGKAYYDGVPCGTNSTDGSNVFGLTFGSYLGIAVWTFNEDPWIYPVADGGPDNHPNNGWMTGAMDDLRLYTRTLSDADILSIASGGNAGTTGGGGNQQGGGGGSSATRVFTYGGKLIRAVASVGGVAGGGGGGPSGNQGGQGITNNLVAFWPLNQASGTRVDSTGRGNDLTDHGSTPSTTGKISNAADFTANGTSRWLSHVDNADLSVCNCDYVVWAWVNLQDVTRQFFLGKGSSGADVVEYGLEYNSTDDRFRFFHDTTFVDANSLGSPTTGAWHLLIGWYDSTAHTINIQVDNGAVDSVSHTGGSDGANGFAIGRLGDYADGLFCKSWVDAAGISKVLPTTSNLDWLWNGGSGREL